MSSVALSGADTIMINNTLITDLADGDTVDLTFPNDIATIKTGKNGNSIYGLNETGKQAEVVMRVIRGSAGDKFLMGLLSSQLNNFAGTVLMTGQFVKKIGDGTGNITSDTYIMSGGVFNKQVPGKMNVEGNTDQSVSMYSMRFTNSPRVIT